MPAINKGYPIFEDQTIVGTNHYEISKNDLFRTYSANGLIVVEGGNIGQINMYNINGQLVIQQITTEKLTKIKVAKNGVYIVAAFDRTGKNLIGSQKVVVLK